MGGNGPVATGGMGRAQTLMKTSTGIPVYNVSAPALRKTGKPNRVVEL